MTSARPRSVRGDKDNTKSKDKAAHALEATEPSKRPSRTSTRGGASHVKPDARQARQATRATRSSKSRHASRAG